MSEPANSADASQTGAFRRIDVLSVKGGVGKTTISYLVAQAQARATNRPVLLVDADLTGTCMGDLLDENIQPVWSHTSNLAHLICGTPEMLPESLRPETLPVYLHEPSRRTQSKVQLIHEASQEGIVLAGRVVYCPSHSDSTLPYPVDRTILQALVGHETAGGWVGYVIDQIITAADELTGGLGGVIVDHAPGIAALHGAVLDSIRKAKSTNHRALLVATYDRVDLKMVDDFHTRTAKPMESSMRWVVNRVPADAVKRPEVDEIHTGGLHTKAWLREATRIPFDEHLRQQYMKSSLSDDGATAGIDQTIEKLRVYLFEGPSHGSDSI